MYNRVPVTLETAIQTEWNVSGRTLLSCESNPRPSKWIALYRPEAKTERANTTAEVDVVCWHALLDPTTGWRA